MIVVDDAGTGFMIGTGGGAGVIVEDVCIGTGEDEEEAWRGF